MEYRCLGQGPALFWLRGIASTYRTNAPALTRLSEHFQTIQYDYPGDRRADGARLGRITHEHLVDDLIGLMDHLGVKGAHLVGLSFGSTVALRALAGAPERFSSPFRAAVQGAFIRRRFTPAERILLFAGGRLPGTAAWLPLRERILAFNSKMDFPGIIADRWPFYLQENGKTRIRALAHRAALISRLDLGPSVSRIPSKVLLIQGRDDRMVPMRYFEELKSTLPGSESVVMPTVGHIPHITHCESLAQVIGDWLLSCGPPCAAGAAWSEAQGCETGEACSANCPLGRGACDAGDRAQRGATGG
jgi:pimeloyl-ACP methyl ester carboxylesterase